MAHPKLIARVDRRTLMAAGTAALLLGAPAAAGGAPLGEGSAAAGCEEVLDDHCEGTVPEAAEPVTEAAGPVTEAAEPVTEAAEPVTEPARRAVDAAQVVTDPVEQVVDDIVRHAPPVPDPVPEAPPAPDVVSDAVPAPEAEPGPSTPGGGVTNTPSVGTAGAPSMGTSTVPRTAGVTTTDSFEPGAPIAADRRSSLQRHAPVVSSPFAGYLPRLAEDLASSSRAPLSASVEAFTAPLSGTNTPAPDASSWLLATAGGLLLLVGAGHLAHARQRFAASVAR